MAYDLSIDLLTDIRAYIIASRWRDYSWGASPNIYSVANSLSVSRLNYIADAIQQMILFLQHNESATCKIGAYSDIGTVLTTFVVDGICLCQVRDCIVFSRQYLVNSQTDFHTEINQCEIAYLNHIIVVLKELILTTMNDRVCIVVKEPLLQEE